MIRILRLFVVIATAAWSTVIFGFTLISNNGKPAYWPSKAPHYRFNTTASGQFVGGVDASGTPSDEFQPIRRGFETWLTLPGLTLNAIEDSSTADGASSSDHINTIQWVRQNWRSLSFRPPSAALAVTLLSFDSETGAINDADIYFNSESFRWAVVDSGSESSYIDVQNIATHEIGHFFGLDHSSEDRYETQMELADATMYYASSSGETSRRHLHADDELSIRALYGSEDRGIPTITSVEVLSDISDNVEYRIRGTNFNEYTTFVITKNSANEMDVVSRYRMITSATEAQATFDLANWNNGNAQIIAFNDPAHVARISVALESTALGATSAGGGGGGCELRVQEGGPSVLWLSFLGIAAIFILGLRQQKVRIRSKQ